MAGLMSKKLSLLLIVIQVAFIVLFAFFAEYSTDITRHTLHEYYPMFQDVHVMMFLGFGFLMMFLRRYGFSAVGINFLLASFVIQWSMLMSGFLHGGKVHINIVTLLTSDFAAAAVLITFGALLGKTSPLQLIVIAFFEVIFFSVNEWLGVNKFMAADVGGSMFVHVFGAYFGLGASRVLWNKDSSSSVKEGSIYHSDLFAMVGTIFLWVFWPSFNSALAPADVQQHAVINTYLALAACCLVSYAVSSLLDPHGRFNMVHVQNATLAGGVAVGTSADMMISPYGALIVGSLAAILSVFGYRFITPLVADKLKVHDTCGVNNLHGMPGLFAGITGAVVSALASEANYGYSLYEIFPARAPLANTTKLQEIHAVLPDVEAGVDRSAAQQAAYQLAALALSLGMALVTGAFTGVIVRSRVFDAPQGSKSFDDEPWWETPDDFLPEEDKMEVVSEDRKNADGNNSFLLTEDKGQC